ncbi:MAG: LPS export ABC transporter ATP-binding protein [Rhodobiaceae bacterium]|nr:LPS export ABC transporter ATP-binding protein [Rhodobiaceae bacterium]MCC0054633.1 LPS export ABC transporter ATP-binding protein [Rhodobiaceae bacterium]
MKHAPLTGLQTTNLNKAFAGRSVVHAFSCRFARGEIVALLGANGAGKSTLFSLITGVLRPDSGHVTLDGANISDLPLFARAALGISYLPQNNSVFRGMSVEDNIMVYLEACEPDRQERHRKLDALLAEFGLTEHRRQKATRLSGGQRRRCELARAMATDPTYLLLDEPFAGVDPVAVQQAQTIFRNLSRRGVGIVVSDHNITDTLEMADRAYVIDSGHMLAEGTPREIVAHPKVRSLYLGNAFSL